MAIERRLERLRLKDVRKAIRRVRRKRTRRALRKLLRGVEAIGNDAAKIKHRLRMLEREKLRMMQEIWERAGREGR